MPAISPALSRQCQVIQSHLDDRPARHRWARQHRRVGGPGTANISVNLTRQSPLADQPESFGLHLSQIRL